MSSRSTLSPNIDALSNFAGFLLATTMYVDHTKWRRNLIYSIAFSALVYWIFTRQLSVSLPSGILGW